MRASVTLAIVPALFACAPRDQGSGIIGANGRTLTVSVGGSGRGTVRWSDRACTDQCTYTVADGARITLGAEPAPGSSFAGWGTPCSGTGPCDLLVQGDTRVSATFDVPGQTTRVLSVARNGSGAVRSDPRGIDCGATCSASFREGTSIALTAVADAGWRFVGWGGECTGVVPCTVVLRADTLVWATFDQPGRARHALAVSVSGGGSGRVRSAPPGIDCPGTCSAQFDEGNSVALRPEPEGGSAFAGWNGACGGSGSCSLSMWGDATVSATFERNQDECAGVAPGTPGTPVTFSDKTSSYEGTCDLGTSDGWGNVALLTQDGTYPHRTHATVVRSDGTKIGSIAGTSAQIFEQLEGFDMVDNFGGTTTDLVAYSAAGQVQGSVPPRTGSMFASTDPLDGIIGVFSAGNGSSDGRFLEAFDAQAKLRWRTPITGGAVLAIAIDRRGSTLLISDGRQAFGRNVLAGQWFDHSGAPGPVFRATDDLREDVGNLAAGAVQLYGRVGNGFFLQRVGQGWIRQFDSWATHGDPAPDWLVARGPNVKLYGARGGRAYSVIDLPWAGTMPCTHRIEVVTTSGKSCGTVSFPAPASGCTDGRLNVGYDGTVIQLLMSGSPDSANQRTCTWRFWPSFLG